MLCFCSAQPIIRPGANATVSMLRSIGERYWEIEDLQDLVMAAPSCPVTFMQAINMPSPSLPGESGTSSTILMLYTWDTIKFNKSGEESHLTLKHLLLASKSYSSFGERATSGSLTFTRLELKAHLILRNKIFNTFVQVGTYWHINQLHRHVCIVESAIEEDGDSKHERSRQCR